MAHPGSRRRSLILMSCLFALAPLLLLGDAPTSAQGAPGDLDLTFGSGGKVTTDFGGDSWGEGLVLQPDAKIVVVGAAALGTRDFALARYNPDGTLDTAFGTGGKVTTDFDGDKDFAHAVALQADGKIVAAGSADHPPLNSADEDFALARYNSDGTLDSAFGTAGKVTTDFNDRNDWGMGLVLQADGKIVLAGKTAAGPADFALARYNPDGTLDTTFGTNGKLTTDFGGDDWAYAVALQADGKIVVAGHGGPSTDFALARYNPDGTLDTTFGSDGKVSTDFGGYDLGNDVLIQLDWKIVVGGCAGSWKFALARYNPDGALDTSFGDSGKVITDLWDDDDELIMAVALQGDNKILAAGRATPVGAARDFGLLRYNADGTLDTTFGTNGVVTTDFGSVYDGAMDLALQADGRIVLAGSDGNWPSHFALARYLGATPPPTPTPTPTPTPLPDLSIVEVRAVQVVQEAGNTIPLVKDKATMVRVFPKLENPPEPLDVGGLGVKISFLINVTLELDCGQIGCTDSPPACASGKCSLTRNIVYFNGKTYVMTHVQFLQLVQRVRDKPGLAQQKFDQAVFEWGIDAFNFGTGLFGWDEAQPFYPEAEGSITATIDADSQVQESNESNNSSGPTVVKVKAIKPPEYFVAKLPLVDPKDFFEVMFLDMRENAQNGQEIKNRQCDYLRATYPFPPGEHGGLLCTYKPLGAVARLHPVYWALSTCTGPQDFTQIVAFGGGLLMLERYASLAQLYKMVVILPAGCLSASGMQFWGLNTVVFIDETAMVEVTAHEIGHTYEWPDETVASPAGSGWDVLGAAREELWPTGPRISAGTWDWVSFMGGGFMWITYDHYRDLLRRLVTGGADPPALLVTGAVFKDGTGVLDVTYSGESVPSASELGEYAVEALGDAGDVLAGATFPAVFQQLGGTLEIDAAPFAVILPRVDGTRTIVLRGPAGVLDEVQVSDNAPVVSINSITPVTGTQEYDLSWQATDVDGGQLTVSADYSHDGVTYLPLAFPATDVPSPFRFDSSELPGGASVTVRVVATDGVNTGTVVSEPFAVPDKPPVASILSPASGSSVADSVLLQGLGYDPEEFDLQGASLQWSSNVDGSIGEGATVSIDSLSVGQHTITLVVTDSQESTALDSIDISFADNCPGTFNPDQTDTDSDGLGDLCDSDDDNDGLLDQSDNCPAAYNPEQTDTDGDGIGDVCDTSPAVGGVAELPDVGGSDSSAATYAAAAGLAAAALGALTAGTWCARRRRTR